MHLRLRMMMVAAVAVMATVGANAQQSFTWNPNTDPNISGNFYSVDYNGVVGNTSISASTYKNANLVSPDAAALVGSGVAVIFDPVFTGYNLVATNAIISGVFLVSVTDGANVTFTGNQWVTTQQSPFGSLRIYNGLNLLGASNPLTPGPASLATGMAVTPNGNCSVGMFNPAITTLAIAPIISPIDPTKPFGVLVIPLAVPEPTAVFGLIAGGLGLMRMRRRS